MTASSYGCLHPSVEPVILSTGETVAQICTNCLARLDFAFGCSDCDYEELSVVDRVDPVARILTAHCDRHRIQETATYDALTRYWAEP